MTDLDKKIVEWGRFKGINNPDKQTIKLFEEAGELAHEICRSRYDSDELKDALGDIQVVMLILADILSLDLEECKQMAYDTISKRKGKNIDGCFVKDNE